MSDLQQLPVCIIGAGSSGVAAAKALHAQGVAVEGFEIGSDIGGMWRRVLALAPCTSPSPWPSLRRTIP